jgi:hypothetical protein
MARSIRAFLNAMEAAFTASPVIGPGDELVKQFLGDFRQRRTLGRYGRILQLRLAWHK